MRTRILLVGMVLVVGVALALAAPVAAPLTAEARELRVSSFEPPQGF